MSSFTLPDSSPSCQVNLTKVGAFVSKQCKGVIVDKTEIVLGLDCAVTSKVTKGSSFVKISTAS